MTRLLAAPPEGYSGSAGRDEGLREIRDFTFQAEMLVVIDPYAYGGGTASCNAYAEEFARAARFTGTCKALHIIYNSRMGAAETSNFPIL